MKELVLSARFVTGLDSNVAWYETKLEGLGGRFDHAVYQTLLRIRAFPESGSSWRGRFRSMLVRRFRFMIVYTIEEDIVKVVGLFHGSQDPDVWFQRLMDDE